MSKASNACVEENRIFEFNTDSFSFLDFQNYLKSRNEKICPLSQEYFWQISLDNNTVCYPLRVFNANCDTIVGKIKVLNKVMVHLNEEQFLLEDKIYPLDSLFVAFDYLNTFEKENLDDGKLFITTVDFEKKINAKKLIQGLSPYLLKSRKEKKDLIPLVFYFPRSF